MDINKETEIDLWQLIAGGFRFFKRRMEVILSFLLLGLLYSLSNFFTHPLAYKSFYRQEFIALSSVTTDVILSDIINAIPINVKNEKDGNFPEFKKLETNLNKETRLKIIIEVFNPEKIDSLLNAIESRVTSINTLKEKYDLLKKQQLQLLAVVTEQLTIPDSAKMNFGISDRVELIEKKQLVEKHLAQDKIVEFIEINNKPIPTSNTRAGLINVLGFSFLGLVLGSIIAWLLDLLNRKK